MDLRGVLRMALEQCAAEGWQAENDGAYGFVFVARGKDRGLVNLTPADLSAGFGGRLCVLGGAGRGGRCGLLIRADLGWHHAHIIPIDREDC